MCFRSYFRQTSGKATDNKRAQREKFSEELSALCLGMENSLLDGYIYRHWLSRPFFHCFIIVFLKYILLCIFYLHLITIKSILGEWEMGSRHTSTCVRSIQLVLPAKAERFLRSLLSIDEFLPFMLLINISRHARGAWGGWAEENFS